MFISDNIFAQLHIPFIKPITDSSISYKALTIIPIKFINQAEPTATIIDVETAIRLGKLQVNEYYFNGDGNIKLLQVSNKSGSIVCIPAGTVLQGGKQDRMVAQTQLIPPKTKDVFIDVFCVEKGRWSNKSKNFSYGGMADFRLKKWMDSTGSQFHIWREIENRLPNENLLQTTWPYTKWLFAFNKEQNEYVQFFQQYLAKTDSSFAGFIAVADTTIIGCHLFANKPLMAACFKPIIISWVHYLQYANLLKTEPFVKKDELDNYIDKVMGSYQKQKLYLKNHGKAYYDGSKLIHIVAFE
ncbi:MAG: ARPP-1 family domain-containing protein [Chitinophagaceae bacterium]